MIEAWLQMHSFRVMFLLFTRLIFDRRLGHRRFIVFLAIALAAVSAPLMSQQPVSSAVPPSPTVTFTLDFPESNPDHYSISVDSTGHARYECSGKIAEGSDDEPYSAEFEMSPANRSRIFDLAKQSKYFAGNIDSGNAKLAFTGAKVLSYQDGSRSNTARYNFSTLAPVQQLTNLFQSMQGTLDYGRRLSYFHRYQKLALDPELKRMESLAKSHDLIEIHGITPVLQEIVDDNSVLNVVRARAKSLLQISDTGAP